VQPNSDVHGGFFPISTQPLPGMPAIGDATVLGAFSTAAFVLLDSSGNKLKDISLTQHFPHAVPSDFLGTISLPSVPFRVSVSGTDLNGSAYQREFPILYALRPVGVLVNGSSANFVTAGKTTAFSFNVTNVGLPTTFLLTALDKQGFVSGVSSGSVTLLQGSSEAVTVQVTVPSSTPGGTDDTVTLTATSSTDQTVFNSADLTLTITAASIPGDVNGDGKVDCSDLEIVKIAMGTKTGQLGFDPRADVNGDGIVNVLDLSAVARQLPAGTTCQ
jgi:hypothetical protein